MPRSWIRLSIQRSSAACTTGVSLCTQKEVTVVSCLCSAPVSKKSGSFSITRARLKASSPMRRSAATSELVVSMISALGLYVRRRAFVASTFARSGTRSSLLRICKRKVVLVAARKGGLG